MRFWWYFALEVWKRRRKMNSLFESLGFGIWEFHSVSLPNLKDSRPRPKNEIQIYRIFWKNNEWRAIKHCNFQKPNWRVGPLQTQNPKKPEPFSKSIPIRLKRQALRFLYQACFKPIFHELPFSPSLTLATSFKPKIFQTYNLLKKLTRKSPHLILS